MTSAAKLGRMKAIPAGNEAVVTQGTVYVNGIELRTDRNARETCLTAGRENPPTHAARLDDTLLKNSQGNSPMRCSVWSLALA